MELLRKGTGGRSSFNGIIATVFGCTGNVARPLVSQLGRSGSMMVLAFRGDSYFANRLRTSADLGQIVFHHFNLKDEDSVRKAIEHSNVVINLIGRDHATSNFSLSDVNVAGARLIARLARETGVEKLIHFSALNAAEKPDKLMFGRSEFLSTKWEGEQAVREEFPEAIVFRPSDIYSHHDRYVRYYTSYWRFGIFTLPAWKRGKGIYKAPVFVSDVAKAVVNAIFEQGNEGETYQAVGPKLYELHDLLQFITTITERDHSITDLRLDPFVLVKALMAERLFKHPRIHMERLRREHTTDVIDPFTKTIADLGVKLTPIEERFPHEFKYFRYYYFDDPNNYRVDPKVFPVGYKY